MEFLSAFFGRIFQKIALGQQKFLPERKAADPIVGIEFYNRHTSKLLLWIEPDCLEIDLNSVTDYRIEFDGHEYRIEFDTDTVVLYMNSVNSVLRIFERPYSKAFSKSEAWNLMADYSD